VVVLANRAPLGHHRTPDGRIVASRSASGLVTALEPLVEACQGTWVAHSSGDADDAVGDALGRLDVPPANSRYRIRYVSMPEEEYRGYYYGFANEGLWPLCHAVGVPAVFRADDFQMYEAANRRFAAAVADEASAGALVLVQDYHFALAPRMLRRLAPSSRVLIFWHIPWPSPATLDGCPWARSLLDGLLGSNVVGLQTPEDCRRFLECAEELPGAEVDLGQSTVTYRDQVTKICAYPVGVDAKNPALRATPAAPLCRERVKKELGLAPDVRLGVGVDRLDYTKGIEQKFLAVERLLESRPDLRGRFVFAQIAEPSRECLPAYQAARDRLLETSRRVNARFGSHAYRPIHVLEAHHDPEAVYRFYRAADVCFIGSLRDGMNLVAKEFALARDDWRGVLVLSQDAGAARQLRGALLVDPREIDGSAQALARALDMSTAEQARRMRLLRANVRKFSASWWTRQILRDGLFFRAMPARAAAMHRRPAAALVPA
jgi:trehalose 6-phosphate synthase